MEGYASGSRDDVDHRGQRERLLAGVAGAVGRVLGANSINIAHFSLGRQSRGGEALAVVVIDEPASPSVLQELESLDNMKWLKQISLTPLG